MLCLPVVTRVHPEPEYDHRDLSELPVSKSATHIIQKERIDGIIYPSAMDPTGTNVVLFNPTVVQIGPSSLFEIVDMKVQYQDAQLDDN